MKGKLKKYLSMFLVLIQSLCLAGCTIEVVSSDAEDSTNQTYERSTQGGTIESDEEASDETTDVMAVEEGENEVEEVVEDTEESVTDESSHTEEIHYHFRNDRLLDQHYEKHGIEMGFDSEEEYEEAACLVINNEDALHKVEKEDGDDIYYVEETNEFVVVSTDGYIRTYFNPNSGIKYYNRQ